MVHHARQTRANALLLAAAGAAFAQQDEGAFDGQAFWPDAAIVPTMLVP